MGILDLFFKKDSNSGQKDYRRPECPYCHQNLVKVPGAKTKCPHCGNFMFIRTRPKDNARVVVTQKEADQIDEEWTIVSGTHDFYIAEKDEFAKQKELLRQKFGKEPSDNDIKWGLSNKKLLEHAQNGDWGLYRNIKFQMAELLRKEMRFKEALITYLEVCYIDLNGPNNTGGIRDLEILKEFPPFNPKELAFLAPGVIDLIKRIASKLKLENTDIKQLYFNRNTRTEKALKLPISVVDSWQSLEKEIEKLV